MQLKVFVPVVFLFLAIACSSLLAEGLNDGLVARYTFDEGGGETARDVSGNGHDGRQYFCMYVKGNNGLALDFGGTGQDSYVDCGNIDIRGELTIAAWVYAYVWSDKSWQGIAYKSDGTFGIRNSMKRPGAIHFRVNGDLPVDLVSNTILEPLTWYHVAAVFKPGEYMRIYINGVQDAEVGGESKSVIDVKGAAQQVGGRVPSMINSDDSHLMLGASGSSYFCGKMDDIRIYRRALPAGEIKGIFDSENSGMVTASARFSDLGAPSLDMREGDVQLRAYPGGAMEIISGEERHLLTSAFSAPGRKTNTLSAKTDGEASWSPSISKTGPNGFKVTAQGERYLLERNVTLDEGRIRVSDTFTNTSEDDIGIVMWHNASIPDPLESWYLYGVENATNAHDSRTPAINPTCFISQKKGGLGLAVEDTVLRNQLESKVSVPLGSISLGSRHFGLAKGKSYTTSFTVYTGFPDYWAFLNNLRKEWGVPSATIPGPMSFIRVDSWSSDWWREQMAPNPDKFRSFLDRKNMKAYLVAPWYAYWDGFDYTDERFKEIMQETFKKIRAVEPDAKFLACLETYYYFLPRSVLGDTMPLDWESWSKQPAEFGLPPAATAIIDGTPWKDSVWRYPDGAAWVSRSDPGVDSNYKTPPLCLLVYPELSAEKPQGNHLFRKRQAEIDWLLDEVGFDGIYMDMFGYGGGLYTYDRWDGHTVDINGDGEITMKYADLALVTAEAREAWLKHILGKDRIALVNFGQPNTMSQHKIPYLSFVEGHGIGHMAPLDPIPDGSGAAGCQLSAGPISLGLHGEVEQDARQVLGAVKGFLRYGVVYCHYYAHVTFPTSGSGSGEYGPINHMFPITPVELHKGWIKGKERIVSCVSFETDWEKDGDPRVLIFDADGRPVDPAGRFTVERSGDKWRVKVNITDWQDFAVVE